MGVSQFPFLGASFQTAETSLTVAPTNTCQWPWRLEWTSACFINDPLINYGINACYMDADMELIKYVFNREGTENGFAKKQYTYQTLRRKFSMRLVVDDLYLDAFQKMSLNTDVKLLNLKTGESFDLTECNVANVEEDQNAFDYIITFEFEVNASVVQTTACECGPYPTVPFESDCGPNGLEPRGSDDVCSGFDATITLSGNVLTASTTGGPANPATYKWYYDPGTGAFQLLSNTAQSVTMSGYGTYRLVAYKGSCQVQKDFLNQDPCNGLIVHIIKSNNALTAEVVGCANPTFAWTVINTSGASSSAGSTQSIVANVTGNYKVVATCGSCHREAMVYVEVNTLPQCASIANTITESNTQLTANVTGCIGALTIAWSKDAGDGQGLKPISVGASVTKSGSGLYVSVATCGTCVVRAEYLIIDCNIPCNVNVTVVRSGNILTVVKTGFGSNYEVKWYKNNGSGYGSPIGMGDTFTASGNGVYKAVVDDGTCKGEGEIFLQDCNPCNVAVSLAISNDHITATPAGCSGAATYQWMVDPGTGYVTLGATTATITATISGIYKVKVTCGACSAEAAILYSGCPNCNPVNPGQDATVSVC